MSDNYTTPSGVKLDAASLSAALGQLDMLDEVRRIAGDDYTRQDTAAALVTGELSQINGLLTMIVNMMMDEHFRKKGRSE